MSKREARRAALEQRRLQQYETALARAKEDLGRVEWGLGEGLPDTVKLDILRLGGHPRPEVQESWVNWFRFGVTWPDREFRWSERLFRKILIRDGLKEAADWSLEEVADEMDKCDPDFTFLKTMNVGFWEGWENEFPGVDPSRFVPFGADGHFFFFLETIEQQDPKVFCIDHEETGEQPYHSHWTVARLLSCLEPY